MSVWKKVISELWKKSNANNLLSVLGYVAGNYKLLSLSSVVTSCKKGLNMTLTDKKIQIEDLV